jgi:hypothetical protein
MILFIGDNNMVVTIDRSKWLHGEGWEVSRLLRKSDKKMCCVGFFALACGAKEKDILEKSIITNLDEGSSVSYTKMPAFPDSLKSSNNIEFQSLYNVNDDKTYDNKMREIRIKNIFASFGVKVIFIGEY